MGVSSDTLLALQTLQLPAFSKSVYAKKGFKFCYLSPDSLQCGLGRAEQWRRSIRLHRPQIEFAQSLSANKPFYSPSQRTHVRLQAIL